MQLHQLKRVHKNRKPASVGRGGKRGKTSGRGTKGQKARAGRKLRPEMRDLIKKIPRLRGRGKHVFKSYAPKVTIINLDHLEKHFEAGATLTPAILLEKRVIADATKPVKILSDGTLTKKLMISGCLASVTARRKVLDVGGSVA
jgi:large subunit ribosomal protein L15